MSNVLVVEDEVINRSLYKRLLDRVGCSYDMASTLEEARRWISEREYYDLLITDLRLPDGHGTEILEEFRQKFTKARLLMITGSPMVPIALNPKDFGAECIYKPFELDEFLETVTRLLKPS
jgi:DNA-binding NtrC family response regulator